MPDFEIELTLYDERNPRPDPIHYQPRYDQQFLMLVTAADWREAADKAVAHLNTVGLASEKWRVPREQ